MLYIMIWHKNTIVEHCGTEGSRKSIVTALTPLVRLDGIWTTRYFHPLSWVTVHMTRKEKSLLSHTPIQYTIRLRSSTIVAFIRHPDHGA